MGAHPKGPSLIASSGESLAEWIENHQSCLGNLVKAYKELPFLFKVLSVNIALSIQVHPDKVGVFFNMIVFLSFINFYFCDVSFINVN